MPPTTQPIGPVATFSAVLKAVVAAVAAHVATVPILKAPEANPTAAAWVLTAAVLVPVMVAIRAVAAVCFPKAPVLTASKVVLKLTTPFSAESAATLAFPAAASPTCAAMCF